MTTIQSPTRAILFRTPFPRFFPSKSGTPPPLWRPLIRPSINSNLNFFNNLHFLPVNESVTATPVF
jgi:hypothetical protein